MKRFVVELLVEHIDLDVPEFTIATAINSMVRQELNPLCAKVVGFTYRKEKADDQASG